jgi:protein tyrosine/serine phosphatase
MKFYRMKIVKSGVACVVLTILIAAAHLWYMEEQGNFHTITPGEAYRSAQMNRDELKYYIRKFGIHSIINLRGKNVREKWYTDEVAVCRNIGVKHYDLGLNATEAPSPEEISELLHIFQIAPRPVLMHCKAGSDRSGLAAALWEMDIDELPKSVAEEQLSIRFGHMPLGPTQAMDIFLENWKMPAKHRR